MFGAPATRLDRKHGEESSIGLVTFPTETSKADSDPDIWSDGEDLECDGWNDQCFTEPERVKDWTACYIWAPLEQPRDIRLAALDIDPRSNDEIHIELQTMSLDRAVRYHTLSYAWGKQHADDSHLTHSIKCNIHSFPVTAHLHAALKRIREAEALHLPKNASARILLWIDALCINQLDNRERSGQVRMMDEIYRCAESTIVWLGEERQKGEFSKIRQLQKLQGLRNWRSLDPNCHLGPAAKHMIGDSSGLQCQFSRLLERDWFYRRWILQELILSRDVHFLIGKMWLPRQFVVDIAEQSRTKFIPSILRQDKFTGKLLLDNLLDFRHSKCTDIHDYVYALLGISEDGVSIGIDYNSPAEDLFFEVARQHIVGGASAGHGEISKRLTKVLGSAVLSRKTALGNLSHLASWVPVWYQSAWPNDLDSTAARDTDFIEFSKSDPIEVMGLCKSGHTIQPRVEGKALLLHVVLLDIQSLASFCKVVAIISRDLRCEGLQQSQRSRLSHIRSLSQHLSRKIEMLVSEFTADMDLEPGESAFVLPDSNVLWRMRPMANNTFHNTRPHVPSFRLTAFDFTATAPGTENIYPATAVNVRKLEMLFDMIRWPGDIRDMQRESAVQIDSDLSMLTEIALV